MSGDLNVIYTNDSVKVFLDLILLLKPMQSTSLAVMAGLIFMIPGSLVESIWQPIPQMTLVAALSLLYLGIFPSVVAFLFWNTGVSKVGPTQASAYYNLIPVFNVLLASYILNEKLLSYYIVGGMFIIIGIVITSIGQYKTQMRNRVIPPHSKMP